MEKEKRNILIAMIVLFIAWIFLFFKIASFRCNCNCDLMPCPADCRKTIQPNIIVPNIP